MKPTQTSPIENGHGGLPKVNLVSPDGSRAEVYLQGGHVTSWIPIGSDERLFISAKSAYNTNSSIRGGVPVIYPQFGSLGHLTKHGFARTQPWDLISISGDHGTASAVLSLHDNKITRSLWPYAFSLELKVTVGGDQLITSLMVHNTGDKTFQFTAALHTYLKVENITLTTLEGLLGIRYHDTVNRPTPSDWIERVQQVHLVEFPGEIDRVYYGVDNPLFLREPRKATQVREVGFPDVVVWNPGPEKAANLPDMEDDGYQRMVCVEAAIAGAPVSLNPGDCWQGAQILTALGQVDKISSP